jgi:hypothetical protein
MQICLPNLNTKQGAIGLFDYLMASRDSENTNVIFNSDLNLEDLRNIPGGNQPLLDTLPNDATLFSFLGHVVSNLKNQNAQVFQDLYVTWKMKNKTNGIFVEVGTAYPDFHNNTWILENTLGWSGLLIEPDPQFHEKIKRRRKSHLETCAVTDVTGKNLKLLIDRVNPPGTGGIDIHFEGHPRGDSFVDLVTIEIDTKSLVDCLNSNAIEKCFDYLSFDTTGNINDIATLEKMFDAGYRPKILTIGHNYKSHRPLLKEMLQSHGYTQEFEFLSRWDDWFYDLDFFKNQ